MEKLLGWLADPANFAEGLMGANGQAVKLDPWQKSYLRNPAKLVCLLKSRRVGGSWIMAMKFFIRSQTRGRYSGVFVSMNREEARGKIDYVDELHDSLPLRWRLKRVRRSKDEIAFVNSNGRRAVLRSLAAKAPRGRGGDVGISELPHCWNSQAIYEGALHVTARNMDDILTIESTPLGKGGVFHDVCRGVYPGFVRYETPWWLCSALCVGVAEAAQNAPSMDTGARVAKYGSASLKTIFASMPLRAFQQESELEFCDIENAAFPMNVIIACAEADFAEDPGAHLVFRKVARVPSDTDWEWLRRNRKGRLFAGFDPGRKKDQAAMVILDFHAGRFETRMTVSMRDTPFARQRSALETVLSLGCAGLRMDSTGIGMDMAERLQRAYPGVAEGVTFTLQSKSRLVAGAYNAFADRRIKIPADRELMAEIGSIREIVTGSGATIYQPEGGEAHHADLAWSLFLALDAARREDRPATSDYVSVSRRRGALV
ncbi:MAG: hypothetical protein HY751_02990 [Nitrospinae bacterium]|nr:hypothetical protein [Nitrospinota bacterium]